MAGVALTQGTTLLIPSGRDGDHLFVVLNDAVKFEGRGARPHVVLVNLSTVPREGVPYDATCVLQSGCHPFVRVDSYAYYRQARIEPLDHLVNLVEKGVFKLHEPMEPELVQRIRAGLVASPFTSRELKSLPIWAA